MASLGVFPFRLEDGRKVSEVPSSELNVTTSACRLETRSSCRESRKLDFATTGAQVLGVRTIKIEIYWGLQLGGSVHGKPLNLISEIKLGKGTSVLSAKHSAQPPEEA